MQPTGKPVDLAHLASRVAALTEEDDLYDAALEIAATLYDGKQDCPTLLRTVIAAINEKFP